MPADSNYKVEVDTMIPIFNEAIKDVVAKKLLRLYPDGSVDPRSVPTALMINACHLLEELRNILSLENLYVSGAEIDNVILAIDLPYGDHDLRIMVQKRDKAADTKIQ